MALKKDKYNRPDLKIPVSLGVIMDGNGRWAKKRLLPRSAGHRAGGESLRELCKNCGNYGVKYVTVYAFSTENWSRPQDEVDALMKLFVEYFHKYDAELEKEGIRVRFSGDIDAMPEDVRELCKIEEERSANRDKLQLIIALNYGGRREIVSAAQAIAKKVAAGEISPDDITNEIKLTAIKGISYGEIINQISAYLTDYSIVDDELTKRYFESSKIYINLYHNSWKY